MFFVSNVGLELPIHPTKAQIAWEMSDIIKASQSSQSTFLRRACLKYNGFGNLKKALKIADTVIQKEAEGVGIDHVSPYSLAAEGRNITDATNAVDLEGAQQDLSDRITQFTSSGSGLTLRDLGISHFVVPPESTGSQATLVDIEPRL